jgi:hypothetical protein
MEINYYNIINNYEKYLKDMDKRYKDLSFYIGQLFNK